MLARESHQNFTPDVTKFVQEGKIAVIRVNDEAIGFAVETEQATALARDIKRANRFKVKQNVTCRWENRAEVVDELKAKCKEHSDLGWLTITKNYRDMLRVIRSWEHRITA